MNDKAIRDVTAMLAIIAAIAVLLLGLSAQYGWFEIIFLWPLHLFGLLMLGAAVYKGTPKLLLLVLPVFLVPLGLGATLIFACTQGDCL